MQFQNFKFQIFLSLTIHFRNGLVLQQFRDISVCKELLQESALFDSHTYIIGHYNPSVRIIGLVSHTTQVVRVNFIHKQRDLYFKVESEQQISIETFNDNFIYSQSSCQESAERKPPKKYFLYLVSISGLGLEPCLQSSKLSH